jgi:dihydroorotate dehydrogenase (fumarate)
VHEPIDAVKAIMAGADVVQIVSALMKRGPQELARLREGFAAWADRHEYDSVGEMRGSMCFARRADPRLVERGNYLQVLRTVRSPNFPGAGN